MDRDPRRRRPHRCFEDGATASEWQRVKDPSGVSKTSAVPAARKQYGTWGKRTPPVRGPLR